MKKAKTTRLIKDLQFLTTMRPFRNYQNLQSLERVCDYIKTCIEEAGLSWEEQIWVADGNEYKNIICRYNESAKRKLVVGAHYDVCGNQPGADDNGSAVAGLLETMRILAAEQPDIDYCVEMVFYCLEEPPFFATKEMGSYVHAKSLNDNGADIIGMICYEMIGYFSDQPNSQPVPDELAEVKKYAPVLKTMSKVTTDKMMLNVLRNLGLDEKSSKMISTYRKQLPSILESMDMPSTGNFIIVLGLPNQLDFTSRIHAQMSNNSAIHVHRVILPLETELAAMSDHMNYWKFGYNAVMINDTAFVRNPHYHKMTDDIDTLDFDKMAKVIDATCQAVISF